MKGYSEHRGQVSKLDFDPETKQFVAKPVEHAFVPAPAYFSLLEKIVEWRKLNNQKVVQQETLQQLAKLNAEQREDVGMTELFAGQRR